MSTRALPSRLRVAAASVVLLAGGAALLAGCTSDPLADQYREGDNKGYIAADGFETVEIPEADRGDQIVFSGTSDEGETVTSEELLGDVVVVNFWYAACGPCIVEAPNLEAAYESFEGEAVTFLGINTSDQAATARSFARDNGVSYSSLIATGDSDLKLAFAGVAPLNATPVTLVLDSEGRVAARLIGAIEEASILETIVSDTLAETS